VETISYNSIVEKYLGKAPTILSMDIEGKDFEILSNIDFDKFRPVLIVTEMNKYDIKLSHSSKNESLNSLHR
jgi:hypothetical protein